MKVAIITDTHYGIRNDLPIFYDYQKKFNDILFEVIDQQEIKHVLHLGDLYDRRKYVNFLTAQRCRDDLLNPLLDRKINLSILAGNHDIYYKNTSRVNSLNLLLDGLNISIYKEATEIVIDDTKILLLPWISDENRDSTIETIRKTNAQVAFGHLELSGFEMNRGIISEDGMSSDLLGLSKFEIVGSGHFHHMSQQGNIKYLGAMYEFSWSDYEDSRGFHVFDTKTREFEFHRNPFKMFNMIVYNDETNQEDIERDIREKDYSSLKDRFVRIVCIKKKNPYLFDMFMDRLSRENPTNLSIVEDVSPFIDQDKTIEVNQTEDTVTIINKYIDDLQLSLNNDIMKSMMLEIYNEATKIEEVNYE